MLNNSLYYFSSGLFRCSVYDYWSLCNYLFRFELKKTTNSCCKLHQKKGNYSKEGERSIDSSAVIVEHCPLISIFSNQKWNMVIIGDTRWWLSFFFLLRFISLFLRSNVSKFLFIIIYKGKLYNQPYVIARTKNFRHTSCRHLP